MRNLETILLKNPNESTVLGELLNLTEMGDKVMCSLLALEFNMQSEKPEAEVCLNPSSFLIFYTTAV